MNPRRSAYQKLIYLAAIVLLLIGISFLSMPATGTGEGGIELSGVLTRMRVEAQLSGAQIGQIDPTGETLRLTTLGMRGVAANLLWTKANEYKMKKDWANLAATLNQLRLLEPHFVTVWRHQGWNLSYNVSAEFDDYRERYRWVIKGVDYLRDGIRYNSRSPHLIWDVGWFVSHKIGRADESKQFRRLFRDDDDFNQDLPVAYRDNWLVGKTWFRKAEDLVATGASLKQTSPVLFYSDAAMCQMNYADDLEKDGTFGEMAKQAWVQAGEDWRKYGSLPLPATEQEMIQLNDKEPLLKRAAEAMVRLEAIEPGLRERLVREIREKELTARERKALDTPPDQRTTEQVPLAYLAEQKLTVRPDEIARRVKDDAKREQARKLAAEINEAQRKAETIGRNRDIVNFEHWRRRAAYEQTDDALAAREAFYDGQQKTRPDPLAAQEAFTKGFARWRTLLEGFPDLKDDADSLTQTNEVLEKYVKVLEQLDEVFPADFPLADYLRQHVRQSDQYRAVRSALVDADKAQAKGDLPATRKALDSAFTAWRGVIDKYPSLGLMADRKTSSEIMDLAGRYAEISGKLGESLPQDFALMDVIRVQIQHAEGTREARDLVAKADKALEAQKAAEAVKHYEAALAAWRKVLDRFPKAIRTADLRSNADLVDIIQRYQIALGATGKKLPKDFILQDVLDASAKTRKS